MPIILDGKKARESLKGALMKRIKNMKPCLAIVQVGERADSAAYISAKKKFAAEIGALERHIQLPESVKQDEVLRTVDGLNSDAAVHGIIVQLPLPPGIDRAAILNAIAPAKDVDGLSATSVERWSDTKNNSGGGVLWPATTRGIRELLDFYGISLKNKKVAIVGRSNLVGKPTAAMCRAAGAQVTVCHRQTADLAHETAQADILIVAAGVPKLIGMQHVRPGQVVIDVGLSAVSSSDPNQKTSQKRPKKLVGDVDFDAVAPVLGDTGAITPVPGGVGAMTVLGLFENLADACEAGS
jgi:methylenetetrahydrofolate dehydrogenase (NADP+)/methenyltetrahydrofolate cyclohydrolase